MGLYEKLSQQTLNALSYRWREIQSSFNLADYQCAEHLFRVYQMVGKRTDDVRTYLSDFLGEPWQRVNKYLRFLGAYEKVSTESVWRLLGGSSVVILSRIDGRSRPRVTRAMQRYADERNISALSDVAFREILIEEIGVEEYERIRTYNRRANPSPGIVDAYRQDMAMVIAAMPGIKASLSEAVKSDLQRRNVA